MNKLFTSKWWGKHIGSTDDSLLLLDYFGNNNKIIFELTDILKEIHLCGLIENGKLVDGDLYYIQSSEYIPHFTCPLMS